MTKRFVTKKPVYNVNTQLLQISMKTSCRANIIYDYSETTTYPQPGKKFAKLPIVFVNSSLILLSNC